MIETKRAIATDLKKIGVFDKTVVSDENRLRDVRDAIDAGTCWTAGRSGVLEGYIVLKPKSFFYLDFVSLLFVKPSARRLGIGTVLFDVAEANSVTNKIFTSTNTSNHQMRELLPKRGYNQVGEVRELDPGDPELFFAKWKPE